MISKKVRGDNSNLIDYKQLFYLMPLPALIFNFDSGKIILANNEFINLSGYAKEEVVGTSVYDTSVLQPEAKKKELFKRISDHKSLSSYTMELINARNSTFFVKVNYNTFLIENKKHIMITLTDTSNQRNILESLMHHLSMERIILHIATEYINTPLENRDETIEKALGEIARFVEADRAYVFDYDFEKQTTSNTHEWCSPGVTAQINNLQNIHFSEIPQWLNKHMNGEDMYIQDIEMLDESGVKKILKSQDIKSILSVPMLKGKKCIGFAGFDSVTAVHKYTQKERKLLHLFSQLLVNIAMRKELLEAKEEAKLLSQAKTELLTNISHELRTPLSGIIGAIETALEAEKKPESVYLLNMALSSSQELEKVFADLYDIVKLGNVKNELSPSKTNLKGILTDVYHLFKIAAKKKGLDMMIHTANIPEFVMIDKHLLKKLLDKLVDNAIKFTIEGRVKIEADYTSTTASHGTLILSVSDTGVGIDHETRENIYELFYQKDLSSTKEFQGLGLGLPIVSSIVEKMSGKIDFVSEKGKGTTFTIRLPVQVLK